jgi:hypothetical protein
MNNELSNSKSGSKIWMQLFIGILGLQAVIELAVGGTLLFNLPMAVESGFGISYNSEMDILGTSLGLYLLFLTVLLVMSIIWTRKGNYAGITLGMIIGVFLLTFGIVAFVQFGDINAILIDSLRGLLTVVFAYMAGKNFSK